MAQSYPLFDKLRRDFDIRKDKNIDIKHVCATINNISNNTTEEDAKEHIAEIYALILHYEMLINNGVLLTYNVYESRTMAGNKGILFKINNLPPALQQIIAQYLDYYS